MYMPNTGEKELFHAILVCVYILNGIHDDNMYFFLWEMNKCVGVVFSMMPHTLGRTDTDRREEG